MANAKKTAPKTSSEQTAALAGMETTSARIRYLAAEGYKTADIARILDIRYQWARNVLITPLKG